MPENTNFKKEHDANRININETQDVRYWTEALGCSAEELRDAVSKVGTSTQAVRNYIQGHKAGGNDMGGGTIRG